MHVYKLGGKLGPTATSCNEAARCQFRRRCPRSGPPGQPPRLGAHSASHPLLHPGGMPPASHPAQDSSRWPRALGSMQPATGRGVHAARPPVGGWQNCKTYETQNKTCKIYKTIIKPHNRACLHIEAKLGPPPNHWQRGTLMPSPMKMSTQRANMPRGP